MPLRLLDGDVLGMAGPGKQIAAVLTCTKIYDQGPADQILDRNLHGGLATHHHAGRYTDSYDLEVELDLEKLMNLKGGLIFSHPEGNWSSGLYASSIRRAVGLEINGDAAGHRSVESERRARRTFDAAPPRAVSRLCSGRDLFRSNRVLTVGHGTVYPRAVLQSDQHLPEMRWHAPGHFQRSVRASKQRLLNTSNPPSA